ncbi:hypothetical protein EJ04DRAFT_577438 [Polyplosphaeria fusca]|uniref:Rab-GAP TBC domain-containing protein n=1 Tax=Polyplosphaeria fusca TaxID=682080 RepID=A0A9P4QTT1_9PLEO|nr:hypothetical protein EJ04DRAFT_577438 [Polyplosphaeria fusca]
MPTTLFARQHLSPPYGPGDDNDLHYLHHSNALYIISEHDFVHSLSAPRELRVKAPPDRNRSPPLRIGPLRRPLIRRIAARPPMATTTLTYMSEANMAPPGVPGSPPDLTNSKSSKSSSFHSSTLSDIMGPNDLTHFEDINLDDLHPSKFPMATSPSHRVLFDAPRPPVSSSRSTPHMPSQGHSFRDLTGSAKPRYPSLKGQVNNVVQQSQLNTPVKTMRRGFTSPSAPSLTNARNLSAPGRRSRSPSPSNPQVFPSGPRSLSRKSSRTLEVSASPTAFAHRRQSWQHATRKTVKELEAECDDEDDEVPEDAVIWNVPISPRPAQERSPVPSAANSPPQATASPASSRAPSQNRAPTSTKSSPGYPGLGIHHSPEPISPSSLSENIPPQPLTRQRTNTWEDTYSTLDSDAKKVTEALEEFQTEFERQQEVKRQNPGLSRSSSVEEHKPKKTQSLPPLRKSDPLIDPFQPSVEKQKYLSRTRPSWLPPKNPKEEKKHLKEYQKMLARIEEAERIEAHRQEEEKVAREKAERVKAEYWETLLLPNWAREMTTPECKGTHRKMWWNGVPPKLRGIVWQKAIGNDLEISDTTFQRALNAANTQLHSTFASRHASIIESTKTVFPSLKMFAPASPTADAQPCHQDLVDVCLAYASYRSDIDAFDGLHHIAGLFLLQMSPSATFSTLCNLLNRPLPLSFLVRDSTAMTAAYATTLSALDKKFPALAARLRELRVEPSAYLEGAFQSAYCGRLGVEEASRVMDVYAVEGDKILPRVAVGLMGVLEGRCLGGSVEEVVQMLQEGGVREGVDEFMGGVYEAGKSG